MPRESFHEELDALGRSVAELGRAAGAQLERAVDVLQRRDAALAAAIRRDDLPINDAYASIDSRTVAIIARQSPMASDLRLLLATLSTATEIERIADHAADIAELVQQAGDVPLADLPDSMRELATRAGAMLRDALAAFEARDAVAARALATADDEVDALERDAYRALVERAREDPSALEGSILLIVAAHHLERVADRATNIGEQTVYAVSGVLDELNPSITTR